MALAAYRGVLRAARIAFREDHRVLEAARHQASGAFNQSRSLRPGSPEAAAQIEHAQAVAKILRENVVQGVRIQGRAGEGEEQRYELRIHEHIERGDNDSIKTGKTAGRKDTTSQLGRTR